MNSVWLIYKNHEVVAARSTETLAKIFVNIEQKKDPDAVFAIMEQEVSR